MKAFYSQVAEMQKKKQADEEKEASAAKDEGKTKKEEGKWMKQLLLLMIKFIY